MFYQLEPLLIKITTRELNLKLDSFSFLNLFLAYLSFPKLFSLFCSPSALFSTKIWHSSIVGRHHLPTEHVNSVHATLILPSQTSHAHHLSQPSSIPPPSILSPTCTPIITLSEFSSTQKLPHLTGEVNTTLSNQDFFSLPSAKLFQA